MGKKKGLPSKKHKLNSVQKEKIREVIHFDASEVPEHRGLIDNDEYIDPERLSRVIQSRFEKGESPQEIAYYSHQILSSVCSHLQVPGRSKWTTKMEMAKGLYKFFGGKEEFKETKPEKDKKKKQAKIKQKKESVPKVNWRRKN